jgi:hypothetical protein
VSSDSLFCGLALNETFFLFKIMTQILHYPKRNRIGVEPVWMPRELSIVERIDLLKKPLTIHDYLRRPMVRRGRWLLRCWDVKSQRYRQFYECAFREFWFDDCLKIGEQIGNKIVPVSHGFEPTWSDRKQLEIILHQVKDRGLVVYSDGLRVIADHEEL